MSIEGQGSLPYIFQVLYVLCFTRPRYQVSVYRPIGPLVFFVFFFGGGGWGGSDDVIVSDRFRSENFLNPGIIPMNFVCSKFYFMQGK